MAQFHSQRSFDDNDFEYLGERIPRVTTIAPMMGEEATQDIYTHPFPGHTSTDRLRAAPVPVRNTDSYNPIVIQNAQTTQSLILALQSTMQPPAKGMRAPIIIPAEKKRERTTEAMRLQQQGQHHGLHLHVRHALAMLASLGVLMFTMISLTPLGSGQSGIPILDNATQWAQTQQLNWDFTTGRPIPMPKQQAPAVNKPVDPVVPAPPPVATNLPRSQYVAIAQDAAIKYGISPVYFERQINQESGFNPYAMSPVGAVGIAQFLPSTAAGMGVNPYDPVDALYGAARMMANLSNQYGGDYAKALAAYNAGPGNVNNAVAAGGANWLAFTPVETQNYVRIIMG
ncbi:hypothetical protein KDA_14780 [Dictyobacter alpinus]|uniref:Transglycosylase SLT domain-containing protein n=1 Tax=Dictyobacter alpinus TaxID=2014873 RepID=A0A402B3Q5_9CHLR|nr:lytic transglycosylase domain-containing protein [Dictyobacter alpinus]GCE25994.1 hypothetical protein KDA_14780 [Dictyobacter alpinus]